MLKKNYFIVMIALSTFLFFSCSANESEEVQVEKSINNDSKKEVTTVNKRQICRH